ncbi:MAG: hypothetical protein ACRDBX_00360 [Erysipelotrichaceae bacterium]
MNIKIALLVLAFLVDSLLALILPNDFSFTAFLFISNLGFMYWVLISIGMERVDRYLFAAVCGLLYGFFFTEQPLVYGVVYVLIAGLIQYWERHLTNTFFEKLMLVLSTLFIKDLALYFLYYIFFNYQISLVEWFVVREFLTLIVNAVFAMGLLLLESVVEDYLEIREHRIRFNEKIRVIK